MDYWRKGELYAYRKGDYKAHFITEGAYSQPPERQEHSPPLLFHLGQDPGEQWNIAASHPDILAEIERAVALHRSGLEIAEPLFDLRFGDQP